MENLFLNINQAVFQIYLLNLLLGHTICWEVKFGVGTMSWGNTSQKTKEQEVLSNITTVAALPISAPFAMADLMSSDFVETLMKIGGQ